MNILYDVKQSITLITILNNRISQTKFWDYGNKQRFAKRSHC
jgi:hypothetical protein